MKKYILFLGIAISAFLTSCEKPVVENISEGTIETTTHTITIGFNSPIELQTKSGNTYDNVGRLDIYYYNISDNLLGHESFSGEDAMNQQISITMEEGSSINVLVLANLPDDLATYIGRIDSFGITTKIHFPFEEQESLYYPIMGATKYIKFTSNQSVKIDLYRYTYNINIGKVTADFTVASMKNKEIAVKRIMLINTSNQYELVSNLSSNMPESIYGKLVTFDHEILGGGTSGYEVGSTLMRSSKFTMTYDGLREDWAKQYACLLNDNYLNLVPGRVNITDKEIVKKATIITLESNNIIGHADDNSLDKVLEVNKTLTGLAGKYLPHLPINGGRNNQDNVLKLVVEVEINGDLMFYPIHLLAPQPNTIYHIENITLKGEPSPNCNFYPANYDTDLSVSINTASETVVSDITVGAISK